MKPFELRNDRVLLSMPTDQDIDLITTLCQDPEIQLWTTVPSPYTQAHAEQFVQEMVPRGWAHGTSLTWAVRSPSDQRVVGMVGVYLSGDGKGDIGFWLGRDARGRGLMSQTVRLVATCLLDEPALGVTHLIWWAYVGNWASRRVAWATGFRYEGIVRGGQPQRGRRRDAWVGTLCAGDPLAPTSRWLDVPTIEGDDLVLRPFDESDADAVTEACSDAATRHWLGALPWPYTREHAIEAIRSHREEAACGRGVNWAAARPGGPAIGAFSLRVDPIQQDSAEMGYWVHPTVRSTGVATRATRMVARHAFISTDDGGLGLRRLGVTHAEGNDASRAVIERAGFHYAGPDRATHMLPDGSFVDRLRYDLLADEIA